MIEPPALRRMRPAWPYALLAGVALVATWNLFRTPGLPYNVDISGFFPLSVENYHARFWPLWNEHGGMATLQFLPALLAELPLLALGDVLGWDMAAHIKVRIFLGFALAGMGAYALARRYLAQYADRLDRWTLAAIPFAAALFYMFNPWSVHRVFQYFLWMGYVLAPLVILAFERLVDKPSWRRALLLAGLAAVATTDPHNPPYLAILVLPIALVRIASTWRRDAPAAGALLRQLALALGAYVAFAAYWILPYAQNALHDPAMGPTYVMSEQMLGALSRNGSFFETLRLLHNYLPRASFAPAGVFAGGAWVVAGTLLAGLAFLAPVLARRPIVWAYGALAAITLFLGMGANPPAGGAYHWLLFDAPWGEGLSWLFRDPYRWGGQQALAYAMLIPFALAEVLVRARRAPARMRRAIEAATPSAAIACVVLFATPGLAAYMGEVYAPVEVPSEYARANEHLAATDDGSNVVWMPRMLGSTTWGGTRSMAYFDATSSGAPAIGPFRPATSTYFRFVEDAAKDGAQVTPLLARIGTDRIVFHNDRDPARDTPRAQTLVQAGLIEEVRVGDTLTRIVDQTSRAAADTPALRRPVDATQGLVQSFIPEEREAVQLTLRAVRTGEPAPLRVEITSADGTLLLTRHVTGEGPDLVVPIDGVSLAPGQLHALTLTAPGTPEKSRWDVSAYKVDTYTQGELAATGTGTDRVALPGDLSFELQARVRGFVTVYAAPESAPLVRASAARVASPSDLQMLRALATVPAGPLSTDAVVFTHASETARRAFATAERWEWVTGLAASPWEPIVPFLPEDSFLAPFEHTTNAASADGWARGTPEFTYYEWGWRLDVAKLKRESWDLDAGRGLVSTTSTQALVIPVEPSPQDRTLLARVYEHPKGGMLHLGAALSDETVSVGVLDTNATRAAFAWREVGRVPGGASALQMRGDGAFHGVNALAIVDDASLAVAKEASERRMMLTPVTLLANAEAEPALRTRAVALPGLGRFADVAHTADVPLVTPTPGEYETWVRLARESPLPNVSVDGIRLAPLACAWACDSEAPWFATAPVGLRAGAHTLRIEPGAGEKTLIDALALTTRPSGLLGAEAAVPLAWTRVDATHHVVDLDARGPITLVLAVPHDAGWVARVEGSSEVVRSVHADGVVNAFLLDLDGPSRIHLEYEPQTWAMHGAAVSLFAITLATSMTLIPNPARGRARGDPTSEDEA